MRIAILLVLIAISATTETHLTAIKQLREKTRITPFSDYFYGMLELHQSSKLGEVVTIVQSMLDKLIAASGANEAEHSAQQANYEQQISKLENTLETTESELSSVNQQINDLTSDLSSLTQSLSFQGQQLLLLSNQITQLSDNHQEEVRAAEEKLNNNSRYLAAVQEVLRFLSDTLLGNTSLIERERAIEAAKQSLGDRHPISLMIQMTSQYDDNTIRRVITKLEGIAQNVQERLDSINTSSNNSEQQYQTLRSQFETTYSNLDKDKQFNQRQATAKDNDLASAKRRQQELQELIETSKELLDQTRIAQDNENTSYTSKRSHISEEISIVQSALDLLSQLPAQ
ncbi:unnamed protein product [Paramecium primaurelia]|uniref:Trichocyst matrix protein n=1 Tax=Paramecium primaurelia TaxID=5886 RepID=A0A8S1MNT9_PARPR|nr:unnamed protein product [Paramecium primaurelia]CAD8082130.1 unnamed protein product [Paramecium primaurelia]